MQPGDFAVIRSQGDIPALIRAGEVMIDGRGTWNHALICVAVGNGLPVIVEAEPGGALKRPWHYQDAQHEWSAGTYELTGSQRLALVKAANSYVGTPYSFADYAAIAARKYAKPFSVPLRAFVADSRHMICSQLVDRCYQDAGIHLFNDGRWNGYVTPGDLGGLLGRRCPQPARP